MASQVISELSITKNCLVIRLIQVRNRPQEWADIGYESLYSFVYYAHGRNQNCAIVLAFAKAGSPMEGRSLTITVSTCKDRALCCQTTVCRKSAMNFPQKVHA